MQIAIDASALFGPSDGIGRYVSSLVPELIELGGADTHWQLLGRRNRLRERESSTQPAWSCAPNISWRADYLPSAIGRPLSIATSQPLWLNRLAPDVYWGPAHRLSWGIPRTTARVLTIHDLCWRQAPHTMRSATRRLDQWLMPGALHQADKIIAVSQSTANDLLAWQPDLEDKVVVLHEAADIGIPDDTPTRLQALGVRSRFILFVGGLEPRKNLARLIEAFARIPQRVRADTQLVIVGGHGWGGIDVGQLAQRFGVESDVLPLGSVDERCLATLYRFAHCLAMPSLYEGFGLPVLESLSLGTPALVSRGGALEEVAGPAGLLVDALSVQSIADGLSTLLADTVLRSRLAADAKPWALRFSWHKAAAETWVVFHAALARRQRLLSNNAI